MFIFYFWRLTDLDQGMDRFDVKNDSFPSVFVSQHGGQGKQDFWVVFIRTLYNNPQDLTSE